MIDCQMTQNHVLKGWADEMRNILSKPVPKNLPYCERCGMSFRPRRLVKNWSYQRTACAEPGCKKRFYHGYVRGGSKSFVGVDD